MSDGDDDALDVTDVWLCPFDEPSWRIDPALLGPAPRQVRRFHPPIRKSRMAFGIVGVSIATPALWMLLRFLWGGTLALPILALCAALVFSAAVLFGPKLVGQDEARVPMRSEEELTLAAHGVVATLIVERVDYARQRVAGVGYRDATAPRLDKGNAVGRFEAKPGTVVDGMVSFMPSEPSLRDGDEVTVLFDPNDAEVWMPVRAMVDVQFKPHVE